MGACSNLSPTEKCLGFIAYGVDALQDRNFTRAEGAFRLALAVANAPQAELGRDLVPLALLNLSRLRQRQNRNDEARQFREQANSQLEQNTPSVPNASFNLFMASVLMDLGEYRRAIPFWEQTIQLDDSRDPIEMASLLARVGECYSRTGLKDHAVIPLRAAVNTFRKYPEDPRLPGVLNTLGNALRKSSPAEAESCYREAADWHASKGQLLSATPAFGNVAILCSEQGRYAESLELFDKVLKIREQSPGIPIRAVATTLNNVANCYRRMARFPEAFAAVSRAIDLVQDQGGAELAHAYGTRGLIFLDQGRDAEAVEWLKKAYMHHQMAPSPKMDSVTEDLEREIGALKRLGRTTELKEAEERLSLIHTAMNAVPEVSRDLTALSAPMQCAVFVELNIAIRGRRLDEERKDMHLGRQLTEILEAKNVGWLAGRVAIPESVTLIFYGSDAETLFQAIEPTLTSEPICAGARVTIRQGDRQRELILPMPLAH